MKLIFKGFWFKINKKKIEFLKKIFKGKILKNSDLLKDLKCTFWIFY